MGQVLVVCTGNVCRSPFIERLLVAHLHEAGVERQYGVHSAGTGALVGEPMDERAAARLAHAGGSSEGFVARALRAELVAEADLVLTATRRHRGQVASLHPKALRYTFTLRDFAGLADQVPAEAAHAALAESGLPGLVAAVAGRRGLTPPLTEEQADIVDPFRRADEVFDRMSEQVLSTLPQVVRVLAA